MTTFISRGFSPIEYTPILSRDVLWRSGRWTLIAEGQTTDDFWGLAEFKGSIYAATSHALYVIDGEDLVAIDLGQGPDVSTSYLHAADGILLSVGDKDILRTEDGMHWVAMPKP